MGREFQPPVIKGPLPEGIACKRLTIRGLMLLYILIYTLPPFPFDRFSTHTSARPQEGASRPYPLLDTSGQIESVALLRRDDAKYLHIGRANCSVPASAMSSDSVRAGLTRPRTQSIIRSI
jgi:hypothetical protein